MDILQNILGGKGRDPHQQVQQYQQAAQNQQVDDLDDDEVQQTYQNAVQQAPPDVVAQAYQEAFNRLPPEEQQKILDSFRKASNDPDQPFQLPNATPAQQAPSGQMPQQSAQATQQSTQASRPSSETPGATRQQPAPTQPHAQQTQGRNDQVHPGNMGEIAKQAQEQQPDLLQNVFGPDGPLSTPMAKIAMVGVAAAIAGKLMGGPRSGGGVLNQPGGGSLRDSLEDLIEKKNPS